jgi:allantoicase
LSKVEPGPPFTGLFDLAAERLGGAVLFANDDFFAPKENLLKTSKPVWIEDRYTDRGKWMDGWESRRRRTPGFDWCVIKLGLPGRVHGFVVDTSYFTGNYPERCSVEGCAADVSVPLAQLTSDQHPWTPILPESSLRGDTRNFLEVDSNLRATHLRFRIFPDGGVARLRVHGEVLPDWPRILAAQAEIDLAAVEHGTRAVASSDRHYGNPNHLLLPGASTHMGDGWETRRRRGPGHDWCILKLGAPGAIRRVEVETTHYKGNFPESCALEICNAPEITDDAFATALGVAGNAPSGAGVPLDWHELLPRSPLQADGRHLFAKELRDAGQATHVRFNIFPDGGVARLRLWGTSRGPS